MKKERKTVVFAKDALNKMIGGGFDLLIGKNMPSGHMWPPTNYKKRSPLRYRFIERPLAEHGVFIPQRSPKDGSQFKTFNDEHRILDGLLDSLSVPIIRYYVDIGAADGIDMSNTYLLAANGWHGLSIEMDANAFAALSVTYQCLPNIDLVRSGVTPENIASLLTYAEVPSDFGVLSLDIDGYDFYVLQEILKAHRPQVIIAEINPSIPASVCVSLKYSGSFFWTGQTFVGMSVAMLKGLADEHDYGIVEVNGCAAFLMPNEIIRGHTRLSLEEMDAKIVSTNPDIDPVLRKELNASPSKTLDYVSNVLFK